MAVIPGEFNASKHDQMNDYSTIPRDDYIATVIKSELKLTKKATAAKDPSLGQRLLFQLKIQSGKYKGKILFTSLNIIHPDMTTREISEKELATMSRACGKPGRVHQSEELHGIPMKVSVDIEVSPNFPDKNVITMYAPAGGGAIEGAKTSGPAFDETATPQSTETQGIANQKPPEPAEAPKKKKAPWD